MPDIITATDLIEEVRQRPTFDELMARDPAMTIKEDRRAMIEHLRYERAAYLVKKDAKEAKKEAGE